MYSAHARIYHCVPPRNGPAPVDFFASNWPSASVAGLGNARFTSYPSSCRASLISEVHDSVGGELELICILAFSLVFHAITFERKTPRLKQCPRSTEAAGIAVLLPCSLGCQISANRQTDIQTHTQTKYSLRMRAPNHNKP